MEWILKKSLKVSQIDLVHFLLTDLRWMSFGVLRNSIPYPININIFSIDTIFIFLRRLWIPYLFIFFHFLHLVFRTFFLVILILSGDCFNICLCPTDKSILRSEQNRSVLINSIHYLDFISILFPLKFARIIYLRYFLSIQLFFSVVRLFPTLFLIWIEDLN